MRIFLKAKGQSTAEYAIVISLVIAALLAMQVYIRRGLNMGIANTVLRTAGIDANHTATGQYEPYYLHSDYNTTSGPYKEEEFVGNLGNVTRQMAIPRETTRSGNQTITGTTPF